MQDLISRQAVIEYLMTNMNWYDEDGYEVDDVEKRSAITDLINGVPSAQPDAVPVVHGRWTRENSYGTWKCSECGCKVNRANPLKGNIWNYYYCPNCGADMRGEQDG